MIGLRLSPVACLRNKQCTLYTIALMGDASCDSLPTMSKKRETSLFNIPPVKPILSVYGAPETTTEENWRLKTWCGQGILKSALIALNYYCFSFSLKKHRNPWLCAGEQKRGNRTMVNTVIRLFNCEYLVNRVHVYQWNDRRNCWQPLNERNAPTLHAFLLNIAD